MVRLPLSFFLYVFLRKGICPFLFFETSKNEMAWKHIETIEHAEKKIFFMENLLDLDRENRTDFIL